MKLNYQPWEIHTGDFFDQKTAEDKMRFLIRFAVLASSSHNSQPWKFRINHQSILVLADSTRRLRESDKNDRQLFLSIGCAIKNILIAADYYGLGKTVTYFPDKNDRQYAARIDIDFSISIAKPAENHLVFAITKRVSNRNKYSEKLPSDDFLKKIRELESQSLKISVITSQKIQHQLADIILDAGTTAMENRGFRYELSRYVKSNITASKIGMPAFGMGILTFPSLFAPAMIRFLNMNKLNRRNDERILKNFTPAFCIISTETDTEEDWLKVGEVYEEIALNACWHDMKTDVWAAPIQIDNFYKEIQRVMKMDFRPQFLFRIGYTDKNTHHSPRLSVSEVM
jgi:nitroreductase